MNNVKVYVKKPIKVLAIKWTGNNLEEVVQFMEGTPPDTDNIHWKKYEESVEKHVLYINTLEGMMYASKDDYIIKGVKGEYYPCKPDIFEITYDEDK